MEKKIIIIALIGFLIFLIGIIIGISIGIQKGQYMLFEGMNEALSGANVNVEIDLNETLLIDGLMEILIPVTNQTINKTAQNK